MAPLSLLALSIFGIAGVSAVTLSVASSGGNTTSPYHYGIMFEDINHSGDGGIYAELIQNRAFQGDDVYPAEIDPWTAVGPATIALDGSSTPLSPTLPTSLKVSATGNGLVGIKNPGWWGIDVQAGQKYTGSFYHLGGPIENFTAMLVSDISQETLASATFNARSSSKAWSRVNYELIPTKTASNSNNSLIIQFEAAAGETINFNLISLFPPTYNDSPNGNRADIMQVLKDLQPSYLRAPGGNNLEGNAPPYYWNWSQSIGPLEDRQGYPGTWGYENTMGLGLVEYLNWCRDLGMEPMLAIWAGFWLDGTSISEADLQPYVDDALNELEFCMGDDTTPWGAVRARLGYPEPFTIKFVEIGNEDDLNNGEGTYAAYRFNMFYDAITAKYPGVSVFSSSTVYVYKNSGQDYHQYTLPDIFVSQFNYFDNWNDTNPIMVGEWATVQNNTAGATGVDWSAPKNMFPYWIGTVSEAVFLLGTERNSNKIFGVSYAPLLQNLNSYEWSPDLISFTADPSQTVLSTSYHMVKLFSSNRLSNTLPARSDSAFGPAYWVTGEDAASFMLKAAVYNSTGDVPFSVAFDGVRPGATAQLTVLTTPAGAQAQNSPGAPEAVIATTTALRAGAGGAFYFELPDLSVAVLVAPKL